MILSEISQRVLTDEELLSLTLGQLKVVRNVLVARGGKEGERLTPIEADNFRRIKVQEVYTRHAERVLKRMVIDATYDHRILRTPGLRQAM